MITFDSAVIADHANYVAFAYSFSTSGSPRRCIAETAQYNVTFLKGISTGKFQHLGEVANMSECSQLACSLSEGDMAYLLEDRCFSVECYTTCDLIKLPQADAVNSAAARLRRSGRRLGTILSDLVFPRLP